MTAITRFRAIIGLLVLLIIGYSGLWYTAAFRAQKNLAQTLSSWRDTGLQVEHGAIKLAGFPYRFLLTLSNVSVATRAEGLVFKSDQMTLISHLWTPDHWIAEVVGMRGSIADGAFAFEEDFAQASYRVHSGDRLVVKVDSNGSDDFRWINAHGLPKPEAWTLLIGKDNSEQEAQSGLYEKRTIEFRLYAERNGAVIDIAGGVSGPPVYDWSRSELTQWRNEGGLLEVDAMTWNAPGMQLSLNGDATLDDMYRPLGSATLSLKGWEAFTKLAPTIGLLPQETAPETLSFTVQNGIIQIGDQTIGRVTPFFRP